MRDMADLQIKPIAQDRWYTVPSVSFLQLNWEINRAGMLSATMPVSSMSGVLREIRQVPVSANTTTLAGMEIKYDHEAAGGWAGIITQVGAANGVATISAMSYEICLRKKIIDIDTAGGDDSRKHPGWVMAELIQKYNATGDAVEAPRIPFIVPPNDANDPTFVRNGTDDVRINVRADAYDEIIPQITEDIGYEYAIRSDKRVLFMKQLGSNLSSSVTLTEGEQISSAQWQDDFLTVTNSIRGYCTVSVLVGPKKKGKYVDQQTFEVRPNNITPSIQQFGVLRERRDYPQVHSKTSLVKQIDLEIQTNNKMLPAITVEMPNVGNIWSRFRQGDTVRLELGHSGYSGKFRIMVRSLDVGRGIMICSGYGDERAG